MLAVEVKLTNTVADHDVKHLMWLSNVYGDQIIDRVIINTGPAAHRRPDGIAVIPSPCSGHEATQSPSAASPTVPGRQIDVPASPISSCVSVVAISDTRAQFKSRPLFVADAPHASTGEGPDFGVRMVSRPRLPLSPAGP